MAERGLGVSGAVTADGEQQVCGNGKVSPSGVQTKPDPCGPVGKLHVEGEELA